jgi:hypothetical protein
LENFDASVSPSPWIFRSPMLNFKLDNRDAFTSALLAWPVYKWGSAGVQGAPEPSEEQKMRRSRRFPARGEKRVGFPFLPDHPKFAR